ncbi:non-specific lipid-transfer protein 1-like [Carica papaya]|uniref:non-specific lipid-transfer protein 1-like n=1 Tax=Carica papaya TaxID=3649 RepID=UPI000B8C896F|nr:non-specific lipid-transfer protein 1-like [Carica papaya]
MANVKLARGLVLFMAVAGALTSEALTCGQVASALGPCLTYLQGKAGNSPPAACCAGVGSLNSAAQTTPDRRTACQCLQSAAKDTNFNSNLAASLPGQCGVSIPYKISTSTNCNTIK